MAKTDELIKRLKGSALALTYFGDDLISLLEEILGSLPREGISEEVDALKKQQELVEVKAIWTDTYSLPDFLQHTGITGEEVLQDLIEGKYAGIRDTGENYTFCFMGCDLNSNTGYFARPEYGNYLKIQYYDSEVIVDVVG